MDLNLLTFFNQTIAHPLLDWSMIGLTTAGLGLLPALGILIFLAPKGQRRAGMAILTALVIGLTLTLIFQYLALRPRPEAVRLIIAQPNFPSYPSGHAAAAFSVAFVVMLTYRRPLWGIAALTGASLIAFSRVYLGQHYPSDILGGAILGAAVGAACYGLMVSRPPLAESFAGEPQDNSLTTRPSRFSWGWLLWLQVAVALIVTQMAYLDILPNYLLRWPLADKVMHFLLIGTIAFWLNLWLSGRSVRLWRWFIPLALLIPLAIALLEEGIQHFSPVRSASFSDLLSDLAGLLFFWWLSQKLLKITDAKYATPTSHTAQTPLHSPPRGTSPSGE